MASRKSKATANEAFGRDLLQSVREMKAGQRARVTVVEPDDIARSGQIVDTRIALETPTSGEALPVTKTSNHP